MKEAPAESRQRVVERLISGDVCERPPFHSHGALSRDIMTSSCKHLLGKNIRVWYKTMLLLYRLILSFNPHSDDRYEQFHAVLLNKEPERLDIALCYEQSTACVGVKHQSFQVGLVQSVPIISLTNHLYQMLFRNCSSYYYFLDKHCISLFFTEFQSHL